MTNYIIIGNGVAANTAAERIRSADGHGRISMFTRERYPYYYLPALPEYIAGERELKDIILHDEPWYRENGIELHLATGITAIDTQSRTVTAQDGRTFPYDKLLLATGGYAFVPPIAGADGDGVFTLRTLDDANRIKAKASESQDLILIGGGLLGLEAGYGLLKAGLKVTVVEFFPRLLPRQMDVAGAAILQRQMEDMGFSFFLGAKTQSISRSNGRLSVSLDSGETIGADMVLISAGVRPELALAEAQGLEKDKALKVNDRMQTTVDDVFAAGDLIEHRGHFYGIWPAAMEQGRVAGVAMTGGKETYAGTVPANTLKVVGISLTAAGDIDVEEKLESHVFQDAAGRVYRKIVVQDNVIAGIILFGDISGSDELLKAMAEKTDVSAVREKLGRRDFDFSTL